MLEYMIATYYVGTRIYRKIRERSAKGSRKNAMVQVHRSRCKVSMLKATLLWQKPNVSFLFFFLSSSSPSPLFFPFPIYIRFLLRWADEVKRRWASTLPMLANATLNLSNVTTSFPPFTAKGPRKRLGVLLCS